MGTQFAPGPNGPIEYKILPDDKIEEVLAVPLITLRQENVSKGVGLFEDEGAPEEMGLIFKEVIKDGCTIIAVDVTSDEVVGVAFNKVHVRPSLGEVDPLSEIAMNELKHRSCQVLMNFVDDAESRVDMYEKYDMDAGMEIFFVSTLPAYRRHKIGQGLVERTVQLCKNFVSNDKRRSKPGFLFGIFTSNFSQSIAAKVGFEWLATIRYDDWEYDGIKMSEKIGNVHQTAKLGGLKL